MEQAARHLPPHPRPQVEGTPPRRGGVRRRRRRRRRPRRRPAGGLRVVFFAERMSTTYFLQFYLILILIVSCVFSSWAIHFQDVAGRLGVDVTLLLVAVSFTQTRTARAAGQLHDVRALLVMSTLFLLLVVIVHSLIGHLTFDCDGVSGDCFLARRPSRAPPSMRSTGTRACSTRRCPPCCAPPPPPPPTRRRATRTDVDPWRTARCRTSSLATWRR